MLEPPWSNERLLQEVGFCPSNVEIEHSYAAIEMSAMNTVLEFEPKDQVIKVQSGMLVHETIDFEGEDENIPAIQDVLAEQGQCLPIWMKDRTAWSFTTSGGTDEIGTQIGLNLPHFLSAQCGSWRDWILGMTVVLADGTIARIGSKAVKNVAGYDLQKLMVGERGSLGIIADVTLRTFPKSALPTPSLEYGPCYREAKRGPARWVQRVRRADLSEALAHCWEHLYVADNESATLWCSIERTDELPRYPGDWVIRSGCGEKNVQITDPTQIRLMKRAKQIFDPTNKLNPGEWGFM